MSLIADLHSSLPPPARSEPSFGAQPLGTLVSADQAVCARGVRCDLLLYSQDAEGDRRFLAETLGLDSVDGHGWLIFAMPPSELAVHPSDAASTELHLMCDDLVTEIASLVARGVPCSAIEEAR